MPEALVASDRDAVGAEGGIQMFGIGIGFNPAPLTSLTLLFVVGQISPSP